MKGDFTRNTFRPGKHYTGVRMQQGRVQLDADWNEQADIQTRLRRQALRDLVGPAGAPQASPGFAITASGASLHIGRGRYYLDGLALECEPPGADWLDFNQQPYLPGAVPAGGPKSGSYQIYLEAWERQVTFLEDPRLREVALGGPDTTTRTQAIWQVKLERIGPPAPKLACVPLPAGFQTGSGTLNARSQPPGSSEEDCLLPPQGGYAGLENHLYRVEIHTGGDEQSARFKWSRENGSVATTWTSTAGSVIGVGSAGKDAVLKFAGGSWVELSSDQHELISPSGSLAPIQIVNEDSQEASLVVDLGKSIGSLATADFPGVRTARRWEGMGAVRDFSAWKELETGLQIRFTPGTYRSGDYWLIPARARTGPAGGTIEWPPDESGDPNQPPAGVARSFGVLAVGNFDGNNWTGLVDCRSIFPPLTGVAGGGGSTQVLPAGCCTVTVGDGVLSQGDFTDLQAALDYARSLNRAVQVCLLPGRYHLQKPVAATASKDAPLILCGCGPAAMLSFSPADSSFGASVGHIKPGESVTLELNNTPPGKTFDVLVRKEGDTSGAWQRAGQLDSGDGGQLPLAMMLPASLAGLKRLQVRVQDSANPRAAIETTVDNAVPALAPGWAATPAPPAGTPPFLLVGDFTRLESLNIESEVPGFPAVVMSGTNSEVQSCSFKANPPRALSMALVVYGGSAVRIAHSRFQVDARRNPQPLCVALHGTGLEFHANRLSGGLQIVPGSSDLEVRENRIGSVAKPDAFTQDQCGILIGKPLDSDLLKSLITLLERMFDHNFQKYLADTPQPVTGLAVEANLIGGALIGIATFADADTRQNVFEKVKDLVIAGNTIRDCGQDVLARSAGFGAGVFLEQASRLQIVDNDLVGNGTSQGGWGINLMHCTSVEISRNLILSNGQVSPGGTASYLQAGIFAFDLRALPGLPAAILRDNTVVTRAGFALFLMAMADVSITGNWFTSEGIINQGQIRPDFIGKDLQSSIRSQVEAEGVCVSVIQPSEAGSIPELVRARPRLLFSTNQIAQVTGNSLPGPTPLINTLFSRGDLAVDDNQFSLEIFGHSPAVFEADVQIVGRTVRVHGNSFTEPHTLVQFSCKTGGEMNSTVDNQAVNCIQVSSSSPDPAWKVDRDNQMVNPCKST